MTRGLPGCLALFVPGMLVAAIEETGLLRRTLDNRRRIWGLLAAATATLIAAALLHGAATGPSGYVARNLLAGVGFGMFLAGVLALRGATRPARAWLRAAAALGTVSYGVYLRHWLVAQVLAIGGWSFGAGRGSAVAWLATFGVLLGATVPLAVASWLLLERPAMQAAAARIARDRAARRVPEMSLGGAPLPS